MSYCVRCVLWVLAAAGGVLALAAVPGRSAALIQPERADSAQEPPRYVPPRGHVCCRAAARIKIDGKFDDAPWDDARWTEDFVEIAGGKEAPRYRTRFKLAWDDDHLYLAALLEEPHVWATQTARDSEIAHDNAFEVLIDPNGDHHEYYELKVNANAALSDVLHTRSHRDGGKPVAGWNIADLKLAVDVRGTRNDPKDEDGGWAIEMALPWKALGELAHLPVPPRDGDQWRINFARVQWEHEITNGKYRKARDQSEKIWVWSPQASADLHQPETWGYLQFSTAKPGEAAFEPDRAGPAKHLLFCLYQAQHEYRKEFRKFAKSLDDLHADKLKDETLAGPFQMETTESGFEISVSVQVSADKTERWRIRQDAKLWRD